MSGYRAFCASSQFLALSGIALWVPLVAQAGSLSSWAWSSTVSGVAVSGTADFLTQPDGAGYDLVIVLSNTGTQLPTSTAQILTGLYFDITSEPGPLSMLSATATLGMLSDGTAQTTATPGTLNTAMCAAGRGENAFAPAASCTVDGGWESAYNASGIGGGASATQHYGIGTTGQTGIFQGVNVNAFDYGIAPGGTVGIDPVTFNGGLPGAYPPGYVYGEATFVLSGLTTTDIEISDVSGAYGTTPEGTPAATVDQPTVVPEPMSTGMALLAGSLLILYGRRRRT